ncbi:hypothetical protein [Geminisphaera colitermitum]|uniref:hypothetical protein n=1 Tax=Geminisphaera colitermitum TaxID=1148786 RepID=UPI000196508C|nr:hypothetical protein [Geminisphaera colitermitum]
MSNPTPQKSRSRRGIIFSFIIVLGALLVVFYLKSPSRDSASDHQNKEEVPMTQDRGGRQGTRTTAITDADQSADADDVGGLVGNTALSDAELVRRLSVVILNESTPASSRSEALAHLLNLTTEEDESVLFTLAGSPKLNEDLGDDLFKDALNRSLATQADLCLVFLGRKEEALRKEAQEHLTFLLDQDLGDKPDAWRAAVNTAKQRWSSK